MKKGDIIEGFIDRVDFGDKGRIITPEGDTIVLKGTLPGQKVRARVLRKKGGAYRGLLLDVLEKAPGEAKSRCPHFPGCGGCSYQHYDYDTAESMKEEQVKRLLSPVLEAQKTACEWLPPVKSPLMEEYRNKMEYTFGDSVKDGPLELGLHKKGSFYDIVSVPGCRITNGDYGTIIKVTVDYFRKLDIPYFHRRDHKGYLRHLLVRHSFSSKELLIGLVTTTQMDVDLEGFKNSILEAELQGTIAGIIHIKNDSLSDAVKCDSLEILHGRDYFYEKLLGLTFKVSLFSFFQTNTKGAERLYETARDFIGDLSDIKGKDLDQGAAPDGDKINIKAAPVIYDLYSGTGTIAQMLAPGASKVYGVELIEDAVIAARENGRLNGLSNCVFIAGDVLKELDNIPERPDLIVLDPPREGVHPTALKHIIDYGVERILYISCKPSSLARDLETLTMGGYEAKKICTVSMFPSTTHIESVVLITRKDK